MRNNRCWAQSYPAYLVNLSRCADGSTFLNKLCLITSLDISAQERLLIMTIGRFGPYDTSHEAGSRESGVPNVDDFFGKAKARVP